MVNRAASPLGEGSCAISNHEGERASSFETRPAPRLQDLRQVVQHAQGTSRSAVAARAAQGDRHHRRAGAPPADGARRHHRSPDPGQADPGSRLGVSPGARSRHDAAAGRAPSRHPAARHRREHLARHHLDLHLRAGAVFGACRRLARRIRDAGFGAVSFRLHRSLCLAFQRACRGRGGRQVEGRSRAGVGDLEPHAVVDHAGGRSARQKSSRGCRSSSAPTIRRRCRYSWCRASPTVRW